MKKQIISLLLILSFSVQSTYPSGLKKAKEILNIKANIRCLAKGDNCTKEKRAMLGAISTLMATLVAAGVIAASAVIASQVGGGKELTGEEKEAEIEKIFNKTLKMQQFEEFGSIKQGARIPLQEVIHDGYSLIGAVVMSPAGRAVVRAVKEQRATTGQLQEFKKIIAELVGAGVQPTIDDKPVINTNYRNAAFGWLHQKLNMP